MDRCEDVQRLTEMILQTPSQVIYGKRTGKGMFYAGQIAEHLLRQGVILPPRKKKQKGLTKEDVAIVMKEYRESKGKGQPSAEISIESIQAAFDILNLQEDIRRQITGPLRYYAAQVPIPEGNVIAYFCGTGVDVVDRAGRVWRNGKVIE